MMLTVFNSVTHISPNVSTNNGAFFKDPAWFDFQAGFIEQSPKYTAWKYKFDPNRRACTQWKTHILVIETPNNSEYGS